MTKKKSLLTFVLAVCLIVPAMFMLTACGHNHKALAEWQNDATYHWHICEDENCKEQLEKAEHTWGDWTVIEASTCTEKGNEERACAVCGHKETRELVLAEHTWGNWTETKASTCTEKGNEERACAVCGHKETRELELAQHEYTYTYNSSTCTIVAPTKDTEGAMLLKCDNCDHKEQVFIYPVISDENYSSNCTNVNNTGWKFSYTLKNAYYTNNQISDEMKSLTQKRIDLDIDLYEDNSGCSLIELLETETDDEMSFSYNFTAPGRYYIAMKDSSTTKAFQSITFTSATGAATSLSSMFVYNESGAKPSDDNNETNIFAWTTTYVSNSIANKTATFLIVVDVETAGAGTLTIGLAK